MNAFAQLLLDSISAAARVGPSARSPRACSASTIPSASGSSGPTTVRSMRCPAAQSASRSISRAPIGTSSASWPIPALPGAQ
jgi:hypothetical protein